METRKTTYTQNLIEKNHKKRQKNQTNTYTDL